MKNFGNVLWGLVFIALGVMIGLKIFDIVDVDIFFDGWWTLFIIVPCFIGLFTEKDRTGNIIGLIVGGLLLLSCQDILSFELVFKLMVPVILVIIGVSLIFKNIVGNSITKKIKELNEKNTNKDNNEYTAVFSGQKIDLSEDNFKGCTVSAIFGGCDIDLTNAIIKEDVVINISTIFGGVDIFVPKNVNVKVNSNSIFGGVENKSKNNEENKVTIYINANCVFGGVEIK